MEIAPASAWRHSHYRLRDSGSLRQDLRVPGAQRDWFASWCWIDSPLAIIPPRTRLLLHRKHRRAISRVPPELRAVEPPGSTTEPTGRYRVYRSEQESARALCLPGTLAVTRYLITLSVRPTPLVHRCSVDPSAMKAPSPAVAVEVAQPSTEPVPTDERLLVGSPIMPANPSAGLPWWFIFFVTPARARL
jgi:hypothetical protein